MRAPLGTDWRSGGMSLVRVSISSFANSLLIAALAASCGVAGASGGQFETDGGVTGSGPETTGTGGDGDADDTTSATTTGPDSGGDTGGQTDGDDGELPVFDLGDPVLGCRGIDFLFVLDSSESMAGEQDNLAASFPVFAQTLEDVIGDSGSHIQVLVTDTDSLVASKCADACESGALGCEGVSCDDIEPLTPCDGTLGAGHRSGQWGQPCGIEGPQRYTLPEQSDLAQTFECLAQVGTAGSPSEQQALATQLALTSQAGDGKCNDGFLREDAILVVTIISDEDDLVSIGSPQSWADTVLAAKGGDPDAVVVLGLLGDTDLDDGICDSLQGASGAQPAPDLRAFVEAFGDHGIWGSVCAPDYGPFFQDAVDLIATTCADFEPEG